MCIRDRIYLQSIVALVSLSCSASIRYLWQRNSWRRPNRDINSGHCRGCGVRKGGAQVVLIIQAVALPLLERRALTGTQWSNEHGNRIGCHGSAEWRIAVG